MVACVCKNIKDSQIIDICLNSDNVKIRDLYNILGVGSECRCCLGYVKELLEKNSGNNHEMV